MIPCSSGAKRTGLPRALVIAASLGWMLDAFDVMLYALVLAVAAGGARHLSGERRRRICSR